MVQIKAKNEVALKFIQGEKQALKEEMAKAKWMTQEILASKVKQEAYEMESMK